MNIRQDNRWEKCLEIIKDNVKPEQFEAWFKPVEFVSFENGVIELRVKSYFFAEQWENKFSNLLDLTFARVFGKFRVKYIVGVVNNVPDAEVSVEASAKSHIVSKYEQSVQQPGNPFHKVEYGDIDPQLNPKYTFENYCDSMSNKLAVSIGKAIATDPRCKTFNPLFVFGPTGVGKTHLIEAIGIKIKETNPRSRVLYLTARVFESQYTTAVKNNKVNEFINFYQSIDVLIIDDIQDLAGKTATQNTFFHIFNHLHQNQKQLIMSSDCRPVDLDGMVPRLMSRFKWGMTVELGAPDYQLRREVLDMRARQDGLSIPQDILDYIASNVTDSIRELEGIIVSLLAHATMLNQEISMDLARAVLANAVKISKKQVTIDLIAETVCSHFNIDSDLLYGKSRKREISDARQIVMYLAKKYTPLSSTNIGLRLSRNHATVLYACNTIEQRLTLEKKLQEDMAIIESELKQ
mgnify:FL=1